jgi:hypothetical protein
MQVSYHLLVYSINQNAIFIHHFLLTTPNVGANESNVGTLINQKTK